MISIIVPVYNAEKTLDQCISTLLNSDFPETGYEILIVDDCSTDGSLAIAQQYRCRVFSLPRNSGAAVARNYGSTKANGDILFFIDSDVLVEPDVLEKIHTIFQHSPDIDAVVGAYHSGQPNQDFFSRYQTAFTYYNHEQCREGIIHWFWGACGAIRKEAFEKAGLFDIKYQGAGAEDIELGYVLSNQGYTIYLDKHINVVHCHRHTFGSILRTNLKKCSEWCTLFLARNPMNRYKHGFTSTRNGLTIMLTWVAMFLFVLYTAHKDTQHWIVLTLCALTAINLGFYRFISGLYGARFLSKAILFHWLTYFLIGVGVIYGVIQFFLKTRILSHDKGGLFQGFHENEPGPDEMK